MLAFRHAGWLGVLVAIGACQDEPTTPKPEVVASAPAPSSASSPGAQAQNLLPAPASAAPPEPSAGPSAATTASAPTAKAPAPSASTKPGPSGPVAGAQSTLTASAKVDPPYHCNEKYPIKFVTAGGSNVTYPADKVKGSCAGEQVASVSIPFVPTAAGAGTVQGTLKYGICDADDCRIMEKSVSLPFTAAAQ